MSASDALDVVRVDRPPGDRVTVSSSSPDSLRPSVCRQTATSNASAVASVASMILADAPQSSCTFRPIAPDAIARSANPGTSVRAEACNPRFTGRRSNASKVRSMRHGGSSNPAVTNVVTPADSATGTSRGLNRCTCESIAPGVRIRPWHGIGHVPGPIVRSMPSVMSGFPARPMPTTRPSLMPTSAFTIPSSGSTTIAPPTTASSSLSEVARSCWPIRDRKFFA